MASTADVVHIHYRRPPDREDLYIQPVVHRTQSCVVTFVAATRLSAPVLIDGTPILEDGAPAVWFTFRDAWHDIGRFHRADGSFTGYYANVLTPIRVLNAPAWETTDLFLDVWLAADRSTRVLDRDELDRALGEGWVSRDDAHAARREVDHLLARIRTHSWPPAIARQWTLERTCRKLGVHAGGTWQAAPG